MRINSKLEIVSAWASLVIPDGWEMDQTSDAFKVHGLTNERLRAEGEPVSQILDVYRADIRTGRVIVAYGAQFDCKVMRGEMRLQAPDDPTADLFEQTRNICLMRACQPFKIPKENGKKGWPQLDDAYRYFVGGPIEGRHSALGDAMAAAKVFIEMARVNALPEPAVHYAKEKPDGKKSASTRGARF